MQGGHAAGVLLQLLIQLLGLLLGCFWLHRLERYGSKVLQECSCPSMCFAVLFTASLHFLLLGSGLIILQLQISGTQLWITLLLLLCSPALVPPLLMTTVFTTAWSAQWHSCQHAGAGAAEQLMMHPSMDMQIEKLNLVVRCLNLKW